MLVLLVVLVVVLVLVLAAMFILAVLVLLGKVLLEEVLSPFQTTEVLVEVVVLEGQ